MIQKIFERSVMRMGREPEHSLIVTIPKKICEKLQIEKGARLYFKLEESRFVVSKDIKSLDNMVSNDNGAITIIESTKENGNKKKEVMADGVSLAELQY
ncbi:MAG: AbrB/MazE/SpoVT family DNA-binding domain-containing protein [Thaumarchaeota archaeon]|nr:AbrB/MazE/SpoVT family DNA-binding domain-containing protein [Nitrososphaerota archaeon]